MFIYFITGYLFVNWLTSFRTDIYDVSFAFESRIPFLPIFSLGYLMAYVGVVTIYFIIHDRVEWYRAMFSFLIATTIAYVTFLIVPVEMTMRPDLANSSGLFISITKIFYFVDKPFNCFPSLHITYPTLATILVWKGHKRFRFLFLGMTIITAVSVVLVKQHYIADIFAGFLTAGAGYYIAVLTMPAWQKFLIKKPIITNSCQDIG